MPNLEIFPSSYPLLTAQTATTNGTSGVMTLPPAQSYRLTVELLTASSTLTNFNLGVFGSSDGGTIYHGLLGLTALTTSGQGQSVVFRPFLGQTEAATVVNAPILGTTDFASNTNVVVNGPFDPRFVKLRWLAVTTGTVTFNVKVDAILPSLND